MKKQSRNIILGIGVLVVFIVLFVIFFAMYSLTITPIPFVWKGIYGGFILGDKGGGECSSWGSSVIGYDSNSTINLKAWSNAGKCSAGGSGANVKFFVNPKNIKNIYIKMNGNARGSTDYASASAGFGISQDNVALAGFSISKDMYEDPEGIFSQGLFLKFDDNFVTIPALITSFPIDLNKDLILSFSVSASTNANGRSADSEINIIDVEITKKEDVCLQVITKACNPVTKEIKDFPTSCVDEGWVIDLAKCEEKNNLLYYVIGSVIVVLGSLVYISRKKIFGV